MLQRQHALFQSTCQTALAPPWQRDGRFSRCATSACVQRCPPRGCGRCAAAGDTFMVPLLPGANDAMCGLQGGHRPYAETQTLRTRHDLSCSCSKGLRKNPHGLVSCAKMCNLQFAFVVQ
ncbi:unnamed protein product [Effrenium voratum]|nr:unnamed protein product [Effrenium voratum]